MADCKLDSKKKEGKPNTFYYRCKPDECKEECVLTFTVDGDGKVVKKIDCECKKIKWDPKNPKDACELNQWQDPGEKKNNKFYFRCEKGDCKKYCAFWIEYGETKDKTTDWDHIKNYGCDCIDWN